MICYLETILYMYSIPLTLNHHSPNDGHPNHHGHVYIEEKIPIIMKENI
jgi:hypothetical protein